MTDYVAIAETETDPKKPARSSLFKRFAKNWIAGFEGAAGAPRILSGAHPTFAAGAVDLCNFTGPNLARSQSHTTASSAAGTVYAEQARFIVMNGTGFRASADLRLVDATTAYMRVLLNDAVVAGVTHSTSTFTTLTANFTCAAGDLVVVETGLTVTVTGGGTRSIQYRNVKLQADQKGVFRL